MILCFPDGVGAEFVQTTWFLPGGVARRLDRLGTQVDYVETESPTLPRELNAILAGLWRRVPADPTRLKRKQLRAIAARVSVSAQGLQLHPEELIIAVKQSWQQRRPSPPEDQRWLLTEMIALCIEEYYARQRVHVEAAQAGLA